MLTLIRSLKGIICQFRLKKSLLPLALCLILFVRTSRAQVADDSQIDYRHQYYDEDDHRMQINTDSVLADIGLGSHFRLTGTYVEDGITGATPTGAPPYNQWNYPTYSSYYNAARSELFQSEYANPNNYNNYLFGAFGTPGTTAALTAYTNFINSTYGTSINAGAAKSAKGNYNNLTNNPNFFKKSVEVTHMKDHRRAVSVGVPFTLGINTFTPQFSDSKEHDYHSYGMAFNDTVLLNQKNTALTGGWSLDNDRVLDLNTDAFDKKISNDFFLGVNQLLSPKSYVTFNLTYGTEHGYLSDPYRGVMLQDVPQSPAGAALSPENRPGHRDKETFYTSYTLFVTPLNGSVEVGYRFFHDTSEIFAQTAELAWHQKIFSHLVLTPMFRYYYQTAANYYYEVVPDTYNVAAGKYVPAPSYYSADYRLSEMETFTAGLTLSYRIQKHVSVDLSYTRYIMQGLDSVTSQTAYPSANMISAGVRLWF